MAELGNRGSFLAIVDSLWSEKSRDDLAVWGLPYKPGRGDALPYSGDTTEATCPVFLSVVLAHQGLFMKHLWGWSLLWPQVPASDIRFSQPSWVAQSKSCSFLCFEDSYSGSKAPCSGQWQHVHNRVFPSMVVWVLWTTLFPLHQGLDWTLEMEN